TLLTRPTSRMWVAIGILSAATQWKHAKAVVRIGTPRSSTDHSEPPNLALPACSGPPPQTRAMSAWSEASRLTQKRPPKPTLLAIVPLMLAQTNKVGGAAEREQTAVAVMPTGAPALSVDVTTVTPPARRRIPRRKVSDETSGSHMSKPKSSSV